MEETREQLKRGLDYLSDLVEREVHRGNITKEEYIKLFSDIQFEVYANNPMVAQSLEEIMSDFAKEFDVCAFCGQPLEDGECQNEDCLG